jgi:hypothetical protein
MPCILPFDAHTFKRILGDTGIPSEISEALSGRRYAGAERYEKLKNNHHRLAAEGIAHGPDALSAMPDQVLAE